jgi:hypothetical protein
MSQQLQELLDELRAEQIPTRPSAPAAPRARSAVVWEPGGELPARTPEQQEEARRIAVAEAKAYELGHPDGFGRRPRLVAAS